MKPVSFFLHKSLVVVGLNEPKQTRRKIASDGFETWRHLWYFKGGQLRILDTGSWNVLCKVSNLTIATFEQFWPSDWRNLIKCGYYEVKTRSIPNMTCLHFSKLLSWFFVSVTIVKLNSQLNFIIYYARNESTRGFCVDQGLPKSWKSYKNCIISQMFIEAKQNWISKHFMGTSEK